MAKIWMYHGKTTEDLQKMSLEEFAKLVPSRERRVLLRGFSKQAKKLLERLRKADKPLKTHYREMFIILITLSNCYEKIDIVPNYI